jgi:hypothetical protein
MQQRKPMTQTLHWLQRTLPPTRQGSTAELHSGSWRLPPSAVSGSSWWSADEVTCPKPGPMPGRPVVPSPCQATVVTKNYDSPREGSAYRGGMHGLSERSTLAPG